MAACSIQVAYQACSTATTTCASTGNRATTCGCNSANSYVVAGSSPSVPTVCQRTCVAAPPRPSPRRPLRAHVLNRWRVRRRRRAAMTCTLQWSRNDVARAITWAASTVNAGSSISGTCFPGYFKSPAPSITCVGQTVAPYVLSNANGTWSPASPTACQGRFCNRAQPACARCRLKRVHTYIWRWFTCSLPRGVIQHRVASQLHIVSQ